MNCSQVRPYIDDYLDGGLAPATERDVAAHVADCAQCRAIIDEERELRQALQDLPVPPTGQDLIAGARERARKRQRRKRFAATGATGLAASFLLAILLGPLQLPGVGGDRSGAARTAQVAVSPGKTQRVKLVFNSPRAMDEVTVHLELPEGVKLAGYPGQRRLKWQTRLEAGRNLLELPVVLSGSQGGSLRAGIRYDGKQHHFRLDVTPRRPAESAILPGGQTA